MSHQDALMMVQQAADELAKAAEQRVRQELHAQQRFLHNAESMQKKLHARLGSLEDKLTAVDRCLESGRQKRDDVLRLRDEYLRSQPKPGAFGAGCAEVAKKPPELVEMDL